MKIICAWCQKKIGEKDDFARKKMKLAVTHSICENCYSIEFAELKTKIDLTHDTCAGER